MPSEILIVEDDARISRYLVTLLEIQGYAVHAVGDGTEALRYLESSVPALMICDLGLPHMGGHQLIKQLDISGLRQFPIVVLTGQTSLQAAQKSFSLQVTHHLVKPVDARTLLALVHHLLHSQLAQPTA